MFFGYSCNSYPLSLQLLLSFILFDVFLSFCFFLYNFQGSPAKDFYVVKIQFNSQDATTLVMLRKVKFSLENLLILLKVSLE